MKPVMVANAPVPPPASSLAARLYRLLSLRIHLVILLAYLVNVTEINIAHREHYYAHWNMADISYVLMCIVMNSTHVIPHPVMEEFWKEGVLTIVVRTIAGYEFRGSIQLHLAVHWHTLQMVFLLTVADYLSRIAHTAWSLTNQYMSEFGEK